MPTTYKECLQINKAFKEKNIPLFVAYYRRSLPRFNKIKSWLNENKIGKVRHINWHLSKPANQKDLSKKYNWRTDANIAYGGYFDDLASHGIDLFIYLLGDIKTANGIAINQQELYTAMDAVTGSWVHKPNITGAGSWNFGSEKREDIVHIYGEKGKITFSVFDENPIELEVGNHKESLIIEHPENIQLFHIKNMRDYLLEDKTHPSTGKTATHTTWVLENILKNNNYNLKTK